MEPENPQFQSVYAIEAMQSGEFDDALNVFDKILEKIPEDPVTLTSRGHALKTLGQREKSIDSYKRAIAKYPGHGEAHFSLSNLKLFKFSDQDIKLMEEQEQSDRVSHMSKIYFNFALGKAYEDKNLFDRAFQYYERGNRQKKAQSRYVASDLTAEFKDQEKVFTEKFIESHADTGCKASDPIFVVGLPRSGSTLLEQILASHSQVDGTMELPNILSLAQKLRRGEKLSSQNHYPGILKEISPLTLKEYGETYIKDTRIHRGKAPFFIDKMPNNFRHIGLISLILPNAKIIDARRHPMACCFSGFKQLFAEGQEFTYGLEEVGTYYKDYVNLMDHWDRVLPNKVFRVQYEDLVTNFDSIVEELLEFCGLDFEKSCVEFYKTDRSVRTPSSEQVRQPIYTSGIEQWKGFDKHLAPLKKSLGNILDRYPIQD
jgi:tetratricopeptide (TPR) repeat protein